MSIIVHCHYYLKEDPQLYEKTNEMRNKTIQEKGCIDYRFVKDFLEDNHYMMVEKWESKEDLDNHLKQSHLQEFSNYINSISLKQFTFDLYHIN